MKEIVLFGGSFNPPHLGHLIVIEQAFELIPTLSEIWLLPAYHHTFGKNLITATTRVAMCELLMKELSPTIAPRTKLCSLEIDQKLSGQTFETLKLLKDKYPEYTFSFLMGSDQLPHFTKWGNWQKLLEQMHFFIYPRGGQRHPITFPNMTLLDSPIQVVTNISSTLIRERLKKTLPTNRVLPSSIQKYISTHNLYANSQV